MTTTQTGYEGYYFIDYLCFMIQSNVLSSLHISSNSGNNKSQEGEDELV